jgi:hypothetical protein
MQFTYRKLRLFKSASNVYQLAPTKMTGLQWFAMTKHYGGTVYGEYSAEYELKRPLKLLNLGINKIRSDLIDMIVKNQIATRQEATTILDPNEQYSGSAQNFKAHNLIKQLLINQCDGTFIDKSDGYDDDELSGPSEIVLWVKPISLVLRRIKMFKAKD